MFYSQKGVSVFIIFHLIIAHIKQINISITSIKVSIQ